MKKSLIILFFSLPLTIFSIINRSEVFEGNYILYDKSGKYQKIVMIGDKCTIRKNGTWAEVTKNGATVMSLKSNVICLSQSEINSVKMKCTNFKNEHIYVIENSNRKNCDAVNRKNYKTRYSLP